MITCSSRKNPYSLLHGGPKGGDFRGGGGGFSRSFVPGAPIKIGELLKSNTVLLSELSVILLIICVAKQKLLFSSMIFYLQSAEYFFHGLHDSLCNTIVVGS